MDSVLFKLPGRSRAALGFPRLAWASCASLGFPGLSWASLGFPGLPRARAAAAAGRRRRPCLGPSGAAVANALRRWGVGMMRNLGGRCPIRARVGYVYQRAQLLSSLFNVSHTHHHPSDGAVH